MSEEREIFDFSIKRNLKYYYLMCTLVAIYQTIMIIYGISHYKMNFRGIVLMTVHVNVAFSSFWLFIRLYFKVKKKNEITKNIRNAVVLYGIFLIVGSMLATVIDMKDGKSTIVYICALLGVSGLFVVNPVFFRGLIGLSFSFLIFASVMFTPFDRDIIIEEVHLCMIIIISIVINHRNYKYNTIAYEKERMIYIDPLTNSYNRRKMDEDVEQLLENDRLCYVGLVDCDNFKIINDTYGHKFGDEVLIYIVNKLQEKFGKDHVYRYGGDEFAIISVLSCFSIQEKIDSVNQELKEEYDGKNIGISAGFSLVERGANLFQEADTVLYEAKKEKNCCIIKK